MAVKAIARSVRISPRKVGEVASLVRGRTVADAVTILEHTPRRAATAVRKVIESAKANADYNHGYKADTLQITTITVTPGVRYKRYRPAAHGRALPFMRRTSHITVIVDGQQRPTQKPAKTEAKSSKSTTKKPETKKTTKKEAK